jgi:hypothetical protein
MMEMDGSGGTSTALLLPKYALRARIGTAHAHDPLISPPLTPNSLSASALLDEKRPLDEKDVKHYDADGEYWIRYINSSIAPRDLALPLSLIAFVIMQLLPRLSSTAESGSLLGV